MRTLALAAAAVTCGFAQTPLEEFEVASVKIAPPRSGPAGYIALDSDPAMIRYANITLRMLIAMAYRVDSDRILSGPAWVDSQKYDLAAKLPSGASKDRIPAMLRSLLADRFKLAVHRETKEQGVYFLTVGKNGHRFKQAPSPPPGDVQQVRGDSLPIQIVPGALRGRSMTMAALAGSLARPAGREVRDRTGLTGTFDIDLKWTPGEDTEIFAALQEQLGLKLEPGRAELEFLVIDRADRIPAEN